MSNTNLYRIRALIVCLGSLLALILLQVCLLNVYSGVCTLIFSVDYRKEPVLIALFHIIYSIVGIFIFVLIYRRYNGIDSIIDKPGNIFDESNSIINTQGSKISKVKLILSLVITGIALQSVAYGLLNLVYILLPSKEVFTSYKNTIDNLNGSYTILIFFYTMILGPILEEYVFRGVILEAARLGFRPVTANVIQALCFGLYHGNLIQGIYSFVLGLVMGYIKNNSRRMLYVILVHMTINISGIVVVPVAAVLLNRITGEVITYSVITLTGIILLVVFLRTTCYNVSYRKQNKRERSEHLF